jgi:hypothetical protein
MCTSSSSLPKEAVVMRMQAGRWSAKGTGSYELKHAVLGLVLAESMRATVVPAARQRRSCSQTLHKEKRKLRGELRRVVTVLETEEEYAAVFDMTLEM